MNGVLSAFVGVPATMLVAGGLGIIGLAIYARVIGTRRGKRPIHWGHVSLGVVMFGLGVLLLWVEVATFGATS
jgi:hypothetical protein